MHATSLKFKTFFKIESYSAPFIQICFLNRFETYMCIAPTNYSPSMVDMLGIIGNQVERSHLIEVRFTTNFWLK